MTEKTFRDLDPYILQTCKMLDTYISTFPSDISREEIITIYSAAFMSFLGHVKDLVPKDFRLRAFTFMALNLLEMSGAPVEAMVASEMPDALRNMIYPEKKSDESVN